MTTRSFIAFTLAAALLVGCGEDMTTSDDQPDGGQKSDAGDASAHMDAGDMSGTDASEISDSSESDGGPGVTRVPTRYVADRVVSPMTPRVVDRLEMIRAADAARDDTVFMKVGASGTVNPYLLSCFSPTSTYDYELAGRTALQETIDYFNMTDLQGATSFDRESLAAESGRTARWARAGSPSPLQQEIDAINPRFAFVNYGTNDMNAGATFASALWPFWEEMVGLLEELTSQGVIPIVTGLNPRGDNPDAGRWARVYANVTRAIAEKHQVPFIDLHQAVRDLDGMGLVTDGVHGNAWIDGSTPRPCAFTAEGLEHNYNLRNLLSLETLHATRRSTIAGAPPPESFAPEWDGSGTLTSPIVIDRLPFSHHGDTTVSASDSLDGYPSCDDGQDESGPEVFYTLEFDVPTPVRVMVFDSESVDVDLHLLDDTGEASSCSARDDRMLATRLAGGSHVLVVDSYVSDTSGELSGEYTLVVSKCAEDAPDCG